MATYLMNSKADLARAARIQVLVDEGEMVASTLVTKRPSDFPCWQGVFYAGEWYPPSDPRGAELDKLRYLLPAPKIEAPPELETDGYDATCGMKPVEQWYLATLWEEFDDWCHCGCPEEPMPPAMFEALFLRPLLYSQTLLSIDRSVVVKPAQPPQFLQSREDVMEQIAMSKAPIDPRKVDELVEAVRFSVEHWENLDARTLPDGYRLYQSPSGIYIYFRHPIHANCIVVGTTDPVIHLMKFVSSRGEIRSYMLKVKQATEPEEAAA